MTEQEQIDEIALCAIGGTVDYRLKVAELVYKKGFRMQREGVWKGNGNLQHCSECGNVVNFNNTSKWLYNFCPNCGAKMKGGE